MDICFHKNAFEDYIFFQKNDKKTVERIHKLLKEVERSPFTGLGKPEALKHNFLFRGYFRKQEKANKKKK